MIFLGNAVASPGGYKTSPFALRMARQPSCLPPKLHPIGDTPFPSHRSGQVHNDFDLSSYISLVRASVIASGLIFELPILIYILTKVGVVTPDILKKYRKVSLVVVLILSAIITPPDIASQVIVSVPIIILYEISIFISRAVIRKQEKILKKQTK